MVADYVTEASVDLRALELDKRLVDLVVVGSQVGYGRVGMNAALPIYDRAGLRPAAIPATILSVIPHYPSVHQTHLDAGWIADSLADLEKSGALANVGALTTGYLSRPDQAEAIAKWLDSSPAAASTPLIVDPTFGDIGLGFYNDPAIVGALRTHLVPRATGLTPNLFELAHLAGVDPDSLTSIEAITAAANTLMTAGAGWVVATGLRSPAVENEREIAELIVTEEGTTLVEHPLVDDAPAGVGDTFTAALICRLIAAEPLPKAVAGAAEATADLIRTGIV